MTAEFFTPASLQPRRPRTKLAPTARSHRSTPNHLSNSPDWWRLRAAIMKALQDFPAARDAVVQALRAIQAGEPEMNPTREMNP